jgi:hypothetical protein
MTRPKILILSHVSAIADVIFAARIRDVFRKWTAQLIYYGNPAFNNFIAQNVPNYTLAKSGDIVRKYRHQILDATVILHIMGDSIADNFRKIGYTGKYYRMGADISVGFARGSIGVPVIDEIPPRTMSIWNRQRYPYDNVFTCVSTGAKSFIDFITQNFAKQRNILVVQGDVKGLFASLPVVREGSIGRVREYSPDLHVVADDFPLHERNELFYYSHNITAADYVDLPICISYGKTPFVSDADGSFWTFLTENGFANLRPVFEGGLTAADIDKKQTRLHELYDYIRESHNLQKNLFAMLTEEPVKPAPVKLTTTSTKYMMYIIIIIVVLTVLVVYYIYLRISSST